MDGERDESDKREDSEVGSNGADEPPASDESGEPAAEDQGDTEPDEGVDDRESTRATPDSPEHADEGGDDVGIDQPPDDEERAEDEATTDETEAETDLEPELDTVVRRLDEPDLDEEEEDQSAEEADDDAEEDEPSWSGWPGDLDDVEIQEEYTIGGNPTDDEEEAEETAGESAMGVGAALRGGPDHDREMPLADHISEMLRRLMIVIAVAGVASMLTFPFAEHLINFLWNSILPAGEVTRPRLYGILELVLTELKVASLVGLIVALPVLVYQTYAFMKPGLYPHERRYYLAAIPTSLVLALIGVSFAFFIILPAIFTYFLYYSDDVATIGFALGRTFDLILLLMGYMALVFQIPLFVMLAMMMGLVTRQWLADRRLIFWGAFLGISFIFSPDPTGMAPIIVAATMIVLFEGTLLLTKWTGRTGRRGNADGEGV